MLVVSDTHVRSGGRRALPTSVLDAAAAADAVVHAGDIISPEVLDTFASLAPTYAVLGNNDVDLTHRLPMRLSIDLGGVAMAVVHDSGPAAGRATRVKRRFPAADVVVFGHSHVPCSEAGIDGQWLLNPGSPTERRRAPAHTIAWVRVVDGELRPPEIVDLGS